jgi:DNA primase
MALPPAFLDELRARIPLAGVIGRRVPLLRAGRQWKGCCPFHGEKTPSFFVYDDHYHCFGCGAHGDAIGFIMQSQGGSFMDAVEQLAAEAGLEVPRPSPKTEEAERRRHDLAAVLEAARAAFQRQLFSPDGRAALDYLRARGLNDDTIRSFGLGWSGAGRGGLIAELKRQGIDADQLAEAGLMRLGDNRAPGGELFFNRVMFPICDRRGRMISFGGRTLGDGQPKYLNGPETAVFSKRRNLFALDRARAARAAAIVVVEGYMDVIALHQAGFAGAVAPLGTAVTDDQLDELWRLTPAPVLCFDGDAAGGRATARTADLALPLLAPDRTLRVASLPQGEDPDTLIRSHGATAFQAVLDAARPLADALYDLLHEGCGDDTPEQRAAFRARLEAAARRVADRSLSAEYRNALLGKYFAARSRRGKPVVARAVPRPVPTSDRTGWERARVLTAILLRHPGLLADLEHAFGGLALPGPLHRLRQALIAWAHAAETLDSAALMSHLQASGMAAEVGQALAAVPVPLPACASPAVMPAEAEAGWWHIFGFLSVDRLRAEVAEAEATFARVMTAENESRLRARKLALLRVESGEPDEVEIAA